jgi:Na+/H+-dicarboxylate symporter/ABC-type amino acid transport substrate-binding protein
VSVATASTPRRRRRGPRPSARILIGLALGVFVGLLIGERAAPLSLAADIYIRLTQMTVLPYLVLTLIGGLGRLDAATARRLGRRALWLMLLLTLLSLAVIFLMPQAFPALQSASFYSDALIEPKQPFAISEIYVPANPFNAMANAIVPGVVLFSAALGLALVGVPGKEPLLASLRALEAAVVRVTRFVLRLTPYGVFAIAAHAAGTLEWSTLVRFEVYFVTFAAASLLLAFLVLPLAVSALTPFGYREVVTTGKDAMITAFVASSAFIVLPMLIERVKEALQAHALRSDEAMSSVDVVVPIAFIVPNAGKLLTLLFVPYAMWLAGTPLGAAGYATLLGAGVPTYFAKAQVALPFLMDLVGAPHDLFQLYIPSSIVTGKFDSMVSVMALLALSLLTAAAVGGHLRWRWTSVLPRAALTVGATLLVVVGVGGLLAATIDTAYHKDEQLRSMHLSRQPLPASVRKDVPEAEAGPGTALQRIRQRGTLRAGFVADRVPFSFTNARGELVGLDIELAEELGRALGVKRVEFVPGDFLQMVRWVAEGRVDIGMGLPYVVQALGSVAYSMPYLDSTLGLVVRDGDRDTFASVEALRAREQVTIGVMVESSGLDALLRQSMPGVKLSFVNIPKIEDFLEGRYPKVDAMAMLAEAGAAWSILYPAFSAVVPQPNPVELPVGIALRRGDRDLADYVDDWLVIARSTGALRRAREYWVLGRGTEPKGRRWSILDDVLGWGRQGETK